VIQELGEPRQAEVVTESGETPTDPTAPKYLVYPVDFRKIDSRFVTDQACVIDLGDSFEASNPPEDLGIPQIYRSPELILDKVAGIESDLWALGCTIFEIRVGKRMFGMLDDDVGEHLYIMDRLLGRLPGRAITTAPATEQPATKKRDREGITSVRHPYVVVEPRSIHERLARGLWYMNIDMDVGKDIHRDIPRDEIEVFADLLGKILKYNPRDRLTANAAQRHEWFKM